ncbi:MAG: sugar ABC transporter substrate-binding protein, partial [Propionibacteriaceae bacterium]
KDQFAQGKVPYTITGPWNLDTFQKGAVGTNYAIESVPSAGGKSATPFVGVQGFYVSAKTQQQLAATKFIVDYMGSQDIQTKFYQTAKRAPANQKAYDAAKSDKDVAAFGAIGANGVAMPNVPAMEFVWTYWGNTELAIMKGSEADPASAWTKMCEAIKKDMG